MVSFIHYQNKPCDKSRMVSLMIIRDYEPSSQQMESAWHKNMAQEPFRLLHGHTVYVSRVMYMQFHLSPNDSDGSTKLALQSRNLQATSHYLNQWFPDSLTHICVTLVSRTKSNLTVKIQYDMFTCISFVGLHLVDCSIRVKTATACISFFSTWLFRVCHNLSMQKGWWEKMATTHMKFIWYSNSYSN